MFKIVRSRVYAETVQKANNLEIECKSLVEKLAVRETYIKALEKQNSDCNAKVQAMREEINSQQASKNKAARNIEELETALKLANVALNKKSEELSSITNLKSRLQTQLKDAFAEIARLTQNQETADQSEEKQLTRFEVGMLIQPPAGFISNKVSYKKVYTVIETNNNGTLAKIVNDEGNIISILQKGSAFLNNADWKVVNTSNVQSEPTEEIPNTTKSVEIPPVEAVKKQKRTYNRSEKYQGKNKNK